MRLVAPMLRTLEPAAASCDYPAVEDVRSGTTYADGSLVGTMGAGVAALTGTDTDDVLQGVIRLIMDLDQVSVIADGRVFSWGSVKRDKSNLPCVVVSRVGGESDLWVPEQSPLFDIRCSALDRWTAQRLWRAVESLNGETMLESSAGHQFDSIEVTIAGRDLLEGPSEAEPWHTVMGTMRFNFNNTEE